MNLSVLIPVFNEDIRLLVRRLQEQEWPPELEWEILIYDDGSLPAFRQINALVKDWTLVRYVELPHNLGRAGIRNRLAKDAKGEYVLFLDGDALPRDRFFLQRYLAKAEPDCLLNGGTLYSENPPRESEKYLRWLYGRKREQKPARLRMLNPCLHFHTFNFFGPRHIISENPFDEKLKQYGYEDTLFAYELKKRGVAIRHIDNPAIHLGLDPAAVFLKKIKQGIDNLLQLQKTYPDFSTRLLKQEEKFARLPLPVFLLPVLEKYLSSSSKPSLFALDLYKWLYLRKCLR